MKKFAFTLQRLYDVKNTEEEQLRLMLEQMNRRKNELEIQRKNLNNEFKKQRELYDKDCRNGGTAVKFQNYSDYFKYLIEAIKNQDLLIRQCMAEIETQTNKLLMLMNEKKVLDRMKVEQMTEYKKEIRKDEDNMIEDFMASRIG